MREKATAENFVRPFLTWKGNGGVDSGWLRDWLIENTVL